VKPDPDLRARIYLQDPLISTGRHRGLTEIRLPGEAWLGAGPTTSRIEVVDHDAGRGVTHPPAKPRPDRSGFDTGRGRPDRSFRHHQVNVWAVAARTLGLLEDPSVFGRRIPWAFPGGRLRILPHADVEENAWYDRDSGALHFCYFEGVRGPVYTCLSHDVITHELGHAVLDGLKPLYNELDSPDVAGFHEYFGDALAMVSALTLDEVVEEVVRDRPARLGARNLVSDIALEFGSRGRGHRPLRSAANRRRMADLVHDWEEHDYSEVLSGAFYDVLRALYSDELPRARAARGRGRRDASDAVAALVAAANRTSRMMLRALDYCPPAGLTYRDYARAVLRADEVAYPVDERGYRELVLGVLRARGVVASRADAAAERRLANEQFRAYDVDRLAATPTDAYVFLDANRELLGIPRRVNFEVANLYRTRKVSAGGYWPPREVVVEYRWSEEIGLRGPGYGVLDGERFPLWCGGTLVFDGDGNVLHHVARAAGDARKDRLRRYLRWLVAEDAFEMRGAHAGRRISLEIAGGPVRAVWNPRLRHAGRA
jgi:hypothetical protein